MIGDHSPILKDIIENTVIPTAIQSGDRWLISMSYWMLNKQKESIRAIIVPLSQFSDKTVHVEDFAAAVQDPNTFILYNQLKGGQTQDLSVPYDLEYQFYLLVSKSYEKLGCPLLALHILTKYYMRPPEEVSTVEDKAEDLFYSESNKPARAQDLFNDEIKTPSRAADLFDDNDDIFAPSKPSYSTNLFDDSDDIFAPKTDLFVDDKDIFASKDLKDETDNVESMNKLVYDGLDAYKAMLVIRLLQVCLNLPLL